MLVAQEEMPRLKEEQRRVDLKTLEQRARAFEHVFDAVVVTDPGGFIIDWNVGAQELYGYSREEAIGQPISLVFPESKYLNFKEQIEDEADINKKQEFEITWLKKSGEHFFGHV